MRNSIAVVMLTAVLGGCGFSTGSPLASGAMASSGQGSGAVDAGALTAGIWDDNANFERFLAFRDAQSLPGKPTLTDEEQQAAHQAASTAAGLKTSLDLALVIDTTGSMGDEIRYFQRELQGIAQLISDRHPGMPMRWALVAYKDVGDRYVVNSAPFVSTLSDYQTSLAGLEASGGDDYPEAADQALAAASQLTWTKSEATARLVFWVADAPHHDGKAAAMTDALRGLRDGSLKLYPIAASGADQLLEYTMRAGAQLTGGRYLFLTDDSGLGGSHEVPDVACAVVTHLNQAMVRAVDIELSGAWYPAAPSEVLRTIGAPVDGTCTSDAGVTTHVY